MAFMYKIVSSLRKSKGHYRINEWVRHPLLSGKYWPTPFLSQYRSVICTVKHHCKKEKPLSSTSIIVQDRVSFVEMPCIVQIINGEFEICSISDSQIGSMGLQYNPIPKTMFKKINFAEESEMSLGFMRCNSTKEVFNLLSTCPEEEITPSIALTVIRRTFDLEDNNRNDSRNNIYNQHPEESNLTFTRSAVIKRLLETICASPEPQIIVEALQSMGRDPNKGDSWNYLEQICAECIILATDGKLNVKQVCEVIKSFHNLGDIGKEFAEKAWVGINEKLEITEDELCCIMSVLPLVKNSRMYLYNIVERKIILLCHKLKPEHVIKIAYILVQLKIPSHRLLALISRWANLNIHKLSEANLRWIVYSLFHLEYTDENIQHAIGRYMKAKKIHIKDYSLVSVIMEYCNKMRVKHPTILNFGSDYFTEHGQNMPASQTCLFMNCFGNLAYVPSEPQSFFKVLESQMDSKFSQFPPTDVLDIFLSCIYIEKYPLNFVKKVFTPHFFDRLHSCDEKTIVSCREKLVIIDTVLTLEAPNYNGPILPQSYVSSTIKRDARAIRCMNKIKSCLIEIFGNEEKISLSVALPPLPSVSLFVIDCVIDATRKINFPYFKINQHKYALFIVLPEHLDITETHLLGPQRMKKRIIEHLGLKVVCINYRMLSRMLMYPDKLKEYLLKQILKANV